jgi:HK97 family phage portal protein
MFKWLNNFRRNIQLERTVKSLAKQNATKDRNIFTLRAVLGGNKPGQWASDHYQETLKYRSWVYCCVNAIMTQVRQSKVITEMEDNNYAKWFLSHPNPYQTRQAFEARRAQQIYLTGTAIQWNVPEEHTDIPERYIIPTCLLQAQRAGHWRFSMTNLSTVYWNEIPSRLIDVIAEQIPFDETTVYRFDHPWNLGDGMSPVTAGAYWIDIADQIDIARFNYNANCQRPGGVFVATDECDLSKEDWDRFDQEVYAKYAGPENTGKNMRTPKGVDFKPVQTTAEELQHQESFLQQRDAILSLFNVPPIAIGTGDAASYSNSYAQMLYFVEHVIQPYLDMMAAEDKRLIESEQFDWVGFYDVDEFEYRARRPDDPDVRDKEGKRALEYIKEKMSSGAYTRDEIRAFFGDGPLPKDARTIGVSRYGMVREIMPDAGDVLVDPDTQEASVEEQQEQEKDRPGQEASARKKTTKKDDSGVDNPTKARL